jgi:hypothetical protein
MNKPLCFVLMPFGIKANAAGAQVNFDAVYQELIRPAIEAAGLEALRADEEMTGGIIHKPMFERLILCEYAVADLTTANANVFYELGVRHAVREWSTVTIFAEGGGQLPFDVAPLRAIAYKLTAEGRPDDVPSTSNVIVNRLRDAQQAKGDSPIYQLLEGFPEVDHATAPSPSTRRRVLGMVQATKKASVAGRAKLAAITASRRAPSTREPSVPSATTPACRVRVRVLSAAALDGGSGMGLE